MSNRLRIALILFSMLLLCPSISGASRKAKTLSKKYESAPLSQVLTDVEKRMGYTIRVSDDDVDLSTPVTAVFKDASLRTVLKKVLPKEVEYKLQRGVVYINRKPSEAQQYTTVATQPTETLETDTSIIYTYADTVCRVTSKAEMRLLPQQPVAKNSQTLRKGHYVGAMLGGGYGSLGYRLLDADNNKAGRNAGGFSGMMQLRYAYFFNENWGITTGIGAGNYFSDGILNHTKQWDGQTDTDGENYDHRATTLNWRERQSVWMVDIPIAAAWQMPVGEKMHLFADLGLKIGIPVYGSRHLVSGSLKHEGWYDPWHLLLDMKGHDFYTENIGEDFSKDRYSLSWRMPAVGVMADAGVLLPIARQLDISLGLWFNYTCNNIGPKTSEPMGWMQPQYDDFRQHAFMEKEYAGIVGSEYTRKGTRPWGVGLSVGILWHHQPKPKKAAKQYERVIVSDTVCSVTLRYETVKIERPAEKIIRQLMEKSVIWFDLDSAEPKLKPADIIVKIAEVLKQNPAQKVLVNGHASAEGSEQHNQELSERRAEAIRQLLLKEGVSDSQIQTKGYSSSVSYEPSQGKHEISLDRRVEIIPVNE